MWKHVKCVFLSKYVRVVELYFVLLYHFLFLKIDYIYRFVVKTFYYLLLITLHIYYWFQFIQHNRGFSVKITTNLFEWYQGTFRKLLHVLRTKHSNFSWIYFAESIFTVVTISEKSHKIKRLFTKCYVWIRNNAKLLAYAR